jgi:Collagen triple helix repeat (20 copies)
MVIAELPLSGLGAILAGIGGIISGWVAIRKAKMEGSKTCHELLNASRLEAEQYSIELHEIKMKHPELGLAALWMVASIGCFAAATVLGMMAVDSVSSQGPPGPVGPQGSQGIQGLPGVIGPQGIQGISGNQGPQGTQGNEGPPGIPGSSGESIVGEQGPQGIQGESGPQGIQGEQGIPGPICPQGFTPTTIGVHQREPIDDTIVILACVQGVP